MSHGQSIMGRGLWASALAIACLAAPWAAAAEAPSDALTAYLAAPKAFRAAAQRVMPAVVRIETSGGLLTAPQPPRPKPVQKPPAEKPEQAKPEQAKPEQAKPEAGKPPAAKPGPGKPIPIRPMPPRRGMQGLSGPGEGPTTGLIISPDGYIITSTYNFLRRPDIITVVLHDGTQHVARLLGRDETRKLCLLKIDTGKPLPVPQLAPASRLRIGQWAITVGVGYGGDEAALSTGIVSALGRISRKAVQTDANISPANYGGPLVDLEGHVIGVCVPLSPQAENTAGGVEWYDSGIGFAVPLEGLEASIQAMKNGKTVEPGKLGLMPQPGTGGKEVVVAQVLPDSPAKKAGLEPKDVITAVDGQPVEDVRKFRSLLGRYVAGDTIKLSVKRGDKTLELQATLIAGTDLPPPMPAPKPDM